jgi:hypothetical protein
MKAALVGLALFGLISIGYPLQQSFTINGNVGFTNLITYGTKVTALSIVTAAGVATNCVYAFRDLPATNGAGALRFDGLSNVAYMSISQTSGTLIVKHTNFGYTSEIYGICFTNFYSNVVGSVTSVTAAGLSPWNDPVYGSATTNAATTTVTVPSGGINFLLGVGLTNAVPLGVMTVTITHEPFL